MNKLIDRLMTKEEIENVKSFDDLLFRKSKYSTDKFTARVLTAEFQNGNTVSFIEDYHPEEQPVGWHNWNCKPTIYTDSETNEEIDLYNGYGGVIEFDINDKDEFLRIFLLNRDYTVEDIIDNNVKECAKEIIKYYADDDVELTFYKDDEDVKAIKDIISKHIK